MSTYRQDEGKSNIALSFGSEQTAHAHRGWRGKKYLQPGTKLGYQENIRVKETGESNAEYGGHTQNRDETDGKRLKERKTRMARAGRPDSESLEDGRNILQCDG